MIKETVGQSDAENAAPFKDPAFAEIEYDFYAGPASLADRTSETDRFNGGAKYVGAPYGAARRFGSSPVPAQPIASRVPDPIREKFYRMRSLASDYPFARYDAGLFYKQGKFMEDFEDDFSFCARFSMYYPNYQHMDYEQLRTYFSWRAKIRQGDIAPISLSYRFLYVYELLSCIGVFDAVDGLDKIMAFWNADKEYKPVFDKYLPRWIKDYHIYYGYMLPQSFVDFVKSHGLCHHYPGMFLFDENYENSLEIWNYISTYDITKSGFYKSDNKKLMKDCFDYVLRKVRALCDRLEIRMEDLLSRGVNASYQWRPFQRALFHNWLVQPDRTVEIQGGEYYRCKDNQWTANAILYETGKKELVGYLIKKAEICLRQTVGYKYSLTASPGTVARELKKLGIKLPEFDKAVEQAVAEFYKDMTRTVVTVDHANLARIRVEASGTRDRLIVSDEGDAASGRGYVFADTARNIGHSTHQSQLHGPEESFGESSAEGMSGDSDEREISDHYQKTRLNGAPYVSDLNASEQDKWDAFKEALNPTEHETLSMVLRGGADIKSFADDNGIMLEVLLDNINGKAADFVGDNILEMGDGVMIYDEYREHVIEMVSTI